jgi:hypothetical protein
MTDEVQTPHECFAAAENPFLRAWVRGVDYLSAWADADSAVAEFYSALEAAGVKADGMHLVASTDDQGTATVLGCSSAEALREVARAVQRSAGLAAEEEAG